ncbi:MAG: DUF1579 domain-containing protein [Lysobacteraceae bacterium]
MTASDSETSSGTSSGAGSAHGGPHQRLARMAGDWEGLYRLWFERDMLAAESGQRGTLRAVLGGRFLLHEYSWEFDGRGYSGVALYGYHIDEKRWECAWVDSFHNGSSIMFSHTTGDADPAHFAVLGSYGDGQTPPGPRWGWRTEIEQSDDDSLVITMTNISPDGEETRAVEVEYTRKVVR